MIYRVAQEAGHGFPDPTATASAKVYAAEMAIRMTNSALQ